MPKNVEFDSKVSDKIVALRDDEGKKWDEVSEAVNMPVGKCMLVYNYAKVPKKDRIKNATAEDIVRLRDKETLSWGVISARTGYPEGSCRSMYEEKTGRSTKGNRIGKGGRYPDGEDKPAKTASAKKASGTTKKGGAKANTKAASSDEKVLAGMKPDAVKAAITGFAIKVRTGNGGEDIIKVAAVKSVKNGAIVLTDLAGQARTVKADAVFMISKKKVAA